MSKHTPAPVTSSAKKKVLLWSAVVAILVAASVLATLELTNTTYLLHARPTEPDTSKSAAKGPANAHETIEQDVPPASTSPSPAVSEPDGVKITGDTSSNTELRAPTGTFANQYDVSVDQQMASTCTSNAGAYCKIVFTKDGVSKSLPTQLTDAGGNTAWSWRPKNIGLTPGIWSIKAVATYGSQAKTTSNGPLTLEVTK